MTDILEFEIECLLNCHRMFRVNECIKVRVLVHVALHVQYVFSPHSLEQNVFAYRYYAPSGHPYELQRY